MAVSERNYGSQIELVFAFARLIQEQYHSGEYAIGNNIYNSSMSSAYAHKQADTYRQLYTYT